MFCSFLHYFPPFCLESEAFFSFWPYKGEGFHQTRHLEPSTKCWGGLALYTNMQPCCRPWRTYHSRKCFSRSKKFHRTKDCLSTPACWTVSFLLRGIFRNTPLLNLCKTYILCMVPHRHACYPCSFNVVFIPFLRSTCPRKACRKALFLLSILDFPRRRVKICHLGPPGSRCQDGIKLARI